MAVGRNFRVAAKGQFRVGHCNFGHGGGFASPAGVVAGVIQIRPGGHPFGRQGHLFGLPVGQVKRIILGHFFLCQSGLIGPFQLVDLQPCRINRDIGLLQRQPVRLRFHGEQHGTGLDLLPIGQVDRNQPPRQI